jgi:hypothetical protein
VTELIKNEMRAEAFRDLIVKHSAPSVCFDDCFYHIHCQWPNSLHKWHC